jgi:hypothetical protein
MLLGPNAPRRDQFALLQAGQFALSRSRSCPSVTDELGCVKAAIRLAKQDAEQPLLSLRE